MYPMRMKAGDIQSRVMISRLLLKMEEQPEVSHRLGLEDATAYPDCLDADEGDAEPADTVSVERGKMSC